MEKQEYIEKLEKLREQRVEARKNNDAKLWHELTDEINEIERILEWD